MKDADRERYLREAVLLEKRLAEATSSSDPAAIDEGAIWEVYAGVEKLVAVLKFRLDYETPGVFASLPDPEHPIRLLADARELLSRSEGDISARRLVDAVEALRKARNNLRSYLTARRREATRAKRPARSKAVTL